jgi:hypothetical protein
MFSQIWLQISYETEKQSKHPSMLLATYCKMIRKFDFFFETSQQNTPKITFFFNF